MVYALAALAYLLIGSLLAGGYIIRENRSPHKRCVDVTVLWLTLWVTLWPVVVFGLIVVQKGVVPFMYWYAEHLEKHMKEDDNE